MSERTAIAGEHRGYELKRPLVKEVRNRGGEARAHPTGQPHPGRMAKLS
jgi:hypothetical protein